MASVDTWQIQQHWSDRDREISGWSAMTSSSDGIGEGDGATLLMPVARPWLSLYGARVRPVPGPYSLAMAREEEGETATIHRMLPDELLMEVFRRVPSWALGSAACVCRKWKYSLRSPALWRTACLKAWQTEGEKELTKAVRASPFLGSWRLMWMLRPRIRFEGLYVSRNTYMRCGIVEWTVKNPVHMVCYFRYLRFFPSGKFYYKISPQFVRDVAKQMHASRQSVKGEGFQVGRYSLSNTGEIQAAIMYPGLRPTVLRMKLSLRSTCKAANNRIDFVSLVTSGLGQEEVPRDEEDDEVLSRCHEWDADETHDLDVPAVSHRRGMATFVFVPFVHAETDILNLPVDKMDFYVPG